VFNPSTVERLTHTLIGAFVLGSFFILSISAWYLLQRKHEDFARRSFSGALIFATIASLAALVTGHSNAQMVARYQPAKLAAMEGHFTTGRGDLTIVGLPDSEQGQMKMHLSIPGGLSLLTFDDPDATVIGLDKVPREYWPPVSVTFFSFHLMVGLGMFFIAITLLACFLRWRGRLFQQRWLLWVFVISIPAPFIANEVGWMTAEVGRQPWIVHPNVIRDASGAPQLDAAGMIQYNLPEGLLTRNAVSEAINGGQVLASILMFSLIYLLLFWIWLYVLNDKIQKGPKPVMIGPSRAHGWLASSAARTLHEDSMSEAKDLRPEEGR
jgi:cytochrome d ubiquinol oxidase subunit I